jgi:hypothetical protein
LTVADPFVADPPAEQLLTHPELAGSRRYGATGVDDPVRALDLVLGRKRPT